MAHGRVAGGGGGTVAMPINSWATNARRIYIVTAALTKWPSCVCVCMLPSGALCAKHIRSLVLWSHLRYFLHTHTHTYGYSEYVLYVFSRMQFALVRTSTIMLNRWLCSSAIFRFTHIRTRKIHDRLVDAPYSRDYVITSHHITHTRTRTRSPHLTSL